MNIGDPTKNLNRRESSPVEDFNLVEELRKIFNKVQNLEVGESSSGSENILKNYIYRELDGIVGNLIAKYGNSPEFISIDAFNDGVTQANKDRLLEFINFLMEEFTNKNDAEKDRQVEVSNAINEGELAEDIESREQKAQLEREHLKIGDEKHSYEIAEKGILLEKGNFLNKEPMALYPPVELSLYNPENKTISLRHFTFRQLSLLKIMQKKDLVRKDVDISDFFNEAQITLKLDSKKQECFIECVYGVMSCNNLRVLGIAEVADKYTKKLTSEKDDDGNLKYLSQATYKKYFAGDEKYIYQGMLSKICNNTKKHKEIMKKDPFEGHGVYMTKEDADFLEKAKDSFKKANDQGILPQGIKKVLPPQTLDSKSAQEEKQSPDEPGFELNLESDFTIMKEPEANPKLEIMPEEPESDPEPKPEDWLAKFLDKAEKENLFRKLGATALVELGNLTARFCGLKNVIGFEHLHKKIVKGGLSLYDLNVFQSGHTWQWANSRKQLKALSARVDDSIQRIKMTKKFLHDNENIKKKVDILRKEIKKEYENEEIERIFSKKKLIKETVTDEKTERIYEKPILFKTEDESLEYISLVLKIKITEQDGEVKKTEIIDGLSNRQILKGLSSCNVDDNIGTKISFKEEDQGEIKKLLDKLPGEVGDIEKSFLATERYQVTDAKRKESYGDMSSQGSTARKLLAETMRAQNKKKSLLDLQPGEMKYFVYEDGGIKRKVVANNADEAVERIKEEDLAKIEENIAKVKKVSQQNAEQKFMHLLGKASNDEEKKRLKGEFIKFIKNFPKKQIIQNNIEQLKNNFASDRSDEIKASIKKVADQEKKHNEVSENLKDENKNLEGKLLEFTKLKDEIKKKELQLEIAKKGIEEIKKEANKVKGNKKKLAGLKKKHEKSYQVKTKLINSLPDEIEASKMGLQVIVRQVKPIKEKVEKLNKNLEAEAKKLNNAKQDFFYLYNQGNAIEKGRLVDEYFEKNKASLQVDAGGEQINLAFWEEVVEGEKNLDKELEIYQKSQEEEKGKIFAETKAAISKKELSNTSQERIKETQELLENFKKLRVAEAKKAKNKYRDDIEMIAGEYMRAKVTGMEAAMEGFLNNYTISYASSLASNYIPWGKSLISSLGSVSSSLVDFLRRGYIPSKIISSVIGNYRQESRIEDLNRGRKLDFKEWAIDCPVRVLKMVRDNFWKDEEGRSTSLRVLDASLGTVKAGTYGYIAWDSYNELTDLASSASELYAIVDSDAAGKQAFRATIESSVSDPDKLTETVNKEWEKIPSRFQEEFGGIRETILGAGIEEKTANQMMLNFVKNEFQPGTINELLSYSDQFSDKMLFKISTLDSANAETFINSLVKDFDPGALDVDFDPSTLEGQKKDFMDNFNLKLADIRDNMGIKFASFVKEFTIKAYEHPNIFSFAEAFKDMPMVQAPHEILDRAHKLSEVFSQINNNEIRSFVFKEINNNGLKALLTFDMGSSNYANHLKSVYDRYLEYVEHLGGLSGRNKLNPEKIAKKALDFFKEKHNFSFSSFYKGKK